MKFDTTTLFFMSDPHFGHKNVIKYANRPFQDVSEMNRKIIENINKAVGHNDHLFINGDFAFYDDEKIIENLLNQIVCKNLYLILGNHDFIFYNNHKLRSLFKKVENYLEIKVKDSTANKGYQKIILFHFPILEWNAGSHGSWMLHGHTHGNLNYPKELNNKKILDIGVDCNHFIPYSYLDIKNIMKNKENIVHHGE
jgi:calcineurin-like phosphoesterase family protein